MAYRYRSRRSARKLAHKSRRNFIITLIIVAILIYATIVWILPTLINGVGFISGIVKPSHKVAIQDNSSLAPPVLNIPYEATNTAQITIRGYAAPHTKVAIYIDDALKDSTQSSEDGSFEIKDISLALGTNNIYGKTMDDDKESLPSKIIKVIYDNEKPSLEIYEPEDGKVIQDERKIKVRGKTEPQAQIFVNDARIITNFDGTFNTDYPLNDGDNILTIKAIDQASNYTEIARKLTLKP